MVIERKADAVAPDGTSVTVRCIISDPATNSKGDLYVSLCLLGLDQLSHAVFGADHWQAVELAMETARDRFEYFSELGWRFYWQKEEPTDQSFEMFPGDMHSDAAEA